VRKRLLRRAVEQNRDVHAGEQVVVAVRPFDHEHGDISHIDRVVPKRGLFAAHTLEENLLFPAFKLRQNAGKLRKVNLVLRAEIAG